MALRGSEIFAVVAGVEGAGRVKGESAWASRTVLGTCLSSTTRAVVSAGLPAQRDWVFCQPPPAQRETPRRALALAATPIAATPSANNASGTSLRRQRILPRGRR